MTNFEKVLEVMEHLKAIKKLEKELDRTEFSFLETSTMDIRVQFNKTSTVFGIAEADNMKPEIYFTEAYRHVSIVKDGITFVALDEIDLPVNVDNKEE